jgi:hypothetical protein
MRSARSESCSANAPYTSSIHWRMLLRMRTRIERWNGCERIDVRRVYTRAFHTPPHEYGEYDRSSDAFLQPVRVLAVGGAAAVRGDAMRGQRGESDANGSDACARMEEGGGGIRAPVTMSYRYEVRHACARVSARSRTCAPVCDSAMLGFLRGEERAPRARRVMSVDSRVCWRACWWW